jgi:EAL domain-containing protein (putative c-di-GMP-specific phosphodiesterase class I)
LLRWSHPTQGEISPSEFIAIAEATDLIRPLTEWTLRAALTQIRRWRERGVHLRIAVNLSARLLQDIAFPGLLRQLLADSGVSAASLELEITESAMMLDPVHALRVIRRSTNSCAHCHRRLRYRIFLARLRVASELAQARQVIRDGHAQ